VTGKCFLNHRYIANCGQGKELYGHVYCPVITPYVKKWSDRQANSRRLSVENFDG